MEESTGSSRSRPGGEATIRPRPPFLPTILAIPPETLGTPPCRPTRIPLTESLKDTVARFLPYWHETIAPVVREGKRVLISAHGNSLRALVKYLDSVSDQDIVGLNIPTGIPLVYELDENYKPIRHYYLGDAETIQRATQAVADQLRKKS